ncbi:hypothetical protein M0804_012380 [Polistes exclamans]|nr:hypothetical protein M0804_012380 [Polistes exclamans]
MRILSTKEKVEAIDRIYLGESKAAVARDIGIPESTLRGWYKSEDKLRAMIENSPDSGPNSDQSNSSGSQSTSINGNMSGIASGSSSSIMDDEGPPGKRPRLDQTVRTTTATTATTMSSGNCSYANELPADIKNVQQTHHQLNHPTQIDPKAYEKFFQIFNNPPPPNQDINAAYAFEINYTDLAKNFVNAIKNIRSSSVTLCNNGLQYAKNNTLLTACNNTAGGSINNQNIGKRHNVAIAPLQIDTVTKSCTRKYLKPAAEAPMNLIPATPKKSNENFGYTSNNSSNSSMSNGSLNGSIAYSAASTSGANNCVTPNNNGMYTGNISYGHKLRKNAIIGTGISSTSTPIMTSPNTSINNNHNNTTTTNLLSNVNSINETLLAWLNTQQTLQQQQQQDTPLNLSNMQQQYDNAAWIWQLYSQLLFPYHCAGVTHQNPIHLLNNVNMDMGKLKKTELDNALEQQLQQKILQQQQEEYRQQQEEYRQQLYQEAQMQRQPTVKNYSMNNNYNIREYEDTASNYVLRSKEDAIRCCDKLIDWLDQCEDPSVTRFQLMTIHYLSLKLKNSRNNIDSHKRYRK